MLNPQQIAEFRERGFLLAREVVSPRQIELLLDELDQWLAESRSHGQNYGATADGRKRFDLEAGHSTEEPRLRRVSNPTDVSAAYRDVLWGTPVVSRVAALIGPNVRFHHCKLNIKLPGMAARVDYHQDHAFDPHTNSDIVVALVMLDDMTAENGALRIVPGSHRERYSLYTGHKFTGAVDPAQTADLEARAAVITGKAGDVCLMHTWAAHGSPANTWVGPGRVLISDYTAADARPLMAPKLRPEHYGKLLCGQATRTARLEAGTIELPEDYRADSFFSVQGQAAAVASEDQNGSGGGRPDGL